MAENKKGCLGSLVKGLSGTSAFGVAHAVGCPYHGLTGLALKLGLLPAAVAAPLYTFHEFVVENIAEPVVDIFIDDPDQVKYVAHVGTDTLGWVALASLPAYFVYSKLKKRYSNSHEHSLSCAEDTN